MCFSVQYKYISDFYILCKYSVHTKHTQSDNNEDDIKLIYVCDDIMSLCYTSAYFMRYHWYDQLVCGWCMLMNQYQSSMICLLIQ